jgi:hypothetical protein
MSNRIDKKELVSATLVQRHLVIPSETERSGVESRNLVPSKARDSSTPGRYAPPPLGMTNRGEKTA